MTTSRSRWLRWSFASALVLALGVGLWYAQHHGWLARALTWVKHPISSHEASQGGMDMNMGGMNMGGMNMPGMDMGGMGGNQSAESSGVPGLTTVQIAPELQQRLGVTTAKVRKEPLRMSVRTVGIVRPNEKRLARVHLRTEGWIRDLFANFTGENVKKGQKLLSIYSPQFVTTQQEYLNAVEARNESLAELARKRLELWDVPDEEISELRRAGKPKTYLTLRSPIAGTILTKNAFEDQYVTPATELYSVTDLSTVWVQAKVYEYELPHVELGRLATVTLPALPDRQLTGAVVFVEPTVEEPARTVQVRVELPNRDGRLKPGMFAHITIEHPMGDGLLVPMSAVIRTGNRDYAFRTETDHRFVPVEVTISPYQFGERFHILSGLKAGDRVVTSANFLIDSESRLRFGGMGGMAGMGGMEMGGMKGEKKHDEGGMKGMDHGKMKH
jgi:Cu(I)/Ag(I) efflux system membrane fusion protein